MYRFFTERKFDTLQYFDLDVTDTINYAERAIFSWHLMFVRRLWSTCAGKVSVSLQMLIVEVIHTSETKVQAAGIYDQVQSVQLHT